MSEFLSSDGKSVNSKWQPYLVKAKAEEFLNQDDLKFDTTNGLQVYSCTSTHFLGYVFNSSANVPDFGSEIKDALPSPFATPPDSNNGVLMGLDLSKLDTDVLKRQKSVHDVFEAFGVDPTTLKPAVKTVIDILTTIGQMAPVLVRVADNKPTRNGLWLFPKDENTLQLATKLTFQLTGADIQNFINKQNFTSNVLDTLRNELGISIPSIQEFGFPEDKVDDFLVIFTTTTDFKPERQPTKRSVLIKLPNIHGFNLYIGQGNLEGDDGYELALTQWGPSDDSASAIQNVSSFGVASDTSAAVPKLDGSDLLNDFHLWYASLNKSGTQTSWGIATLINIRIRDGHLPVFLIYDTAPDKKTFGGGVLTTAALKSNPALKDRGTQEFLPEFKDYRTFPASFPPIQSSYSLNNIFNTTFPAFLPTDITDGSVSLVKEGTKQTFEVNVHLEHPSSGAQNAVPTPFEWKDAMFHYLKESDKEDPSIEVTSTFELKQSDPPSDPPDAAKMELSLKYIGPNWELSAQVKKLSFGALASFVDSSASQSVLSVLGKLRLETLNVKYVYEGGSTSPNKQPSASTFLFWGEIVIAGSLRFDMYYQYTNNEATAQKLLDELNVTEIKPPKVTNSEAEWRFDCTMTTVNDGATIGQILHQIAGIDNVPGFVADIPLTKDNKDPAMSIRASKQNIDGLGDAVVFFFDLKVGFLDATFIQVCGAQSSEPWRIFRFSVGPLPLFNSLPIIKELPQPYQELSYYYVGGPSDVDIQVVDFLNDAKNGYIKDGAAEIYFKNTSGKNQTTALRRGNHFIVVNNNDCVLDHLFEAGDSPSTTTLKDLPNEMPGTRRAVVRQLLRRANTEDADNPPTKGALKKQTQFISISGIALQYKAQVLWLFLDAKITLGPIEMDLIGLGIGLVLSKLNLTKLQLDSIDWKSLLQFQIHGLAMDFDQPPVLIAGMFEHEVTEHIESYRGGIAVGFTPYQFMAVGEYAEVHENGDDYKSIFIYAKLDGPLIDLEIAIIKGVRLGFGYNSFVRSPSVQELADFPFINDTGAGTAGNSPMAVLTAMRGGTNPWVQVKHDAFWFAFGFSVSCFDIITATAVAMLQFSDKGVIANIFADVIAQMPPDSPREASIVYVELLMNAELNFIEDYFFVQAALAPTSFLLVPQCHLFGGFAAGSWWGRSQYAGEWVFSVGGYHPKFAVPAYYPKPDRLGIQFNIGDNMTIRGEGYFAITPKVVMGGAMIFVQLHVGPVSAHLNAGFDVLIYFHPLYYMFDVYVDVGVSCHVHFLFVSFDVSIDIGANLHIEGPEFGGVAHVDFWFFGFDVSFGASPSPPPPISLLEFYDILKKAGPPEHNDRETDKTSHDLEQLLKLTLEDGAFPDTPKKATEGQGTTAPNTGVGAVWRARGGDFQFRISTVFAISSASIATVDTNNLAADSAQDVPVLPDPDPHALHANTTITSVPMRVSEPIQSPLRIKIYDKNAPPDSRIPKGWDAQFVVKTVPKALWGPANYDAVAAVMSGDKSMVPLNMAVSLHAPPPTLSTSHIPPVNATQFMNSQVGGPTELPETESQGEKFLPDTFANTVTANQDPDLQWKQFQGKWEAAGRDNSTHAQTMANEFVSWLGWNKPPPEVLTKLGDDDKKPKPWDLRTAFPARLVTGTGKPDVVDGLEGTYMALPRVMAV